MKKNNIKTKVIGTVLAALCAISAGTAGTAISANAATAKTTSVSTQAATAKSCTYTMKGFDWNYSADSTNAKITCDFTYSNKTCKFIAKGITKGVTNAVLKAKRADGKWNNVPVCFTVDSKLNVTGQQTGRMYVTNR